MVSFRDDVLKNGSGTLGQYGTPPHPEGERQPHTSATDRRPRAELPGSEPAPAHCDPRAKLDAEGGVRSTSSRGRTRTHNAGQISM